jgi:hypothetical protein
MEPTMQERLKTIPWDYLRDASAASLQAYELARLNQAANIRKEIAGLIDQLCDEAAAALLARFLLEKTAQARRPGRPARVARVRVAPDVADDHLGRARQCELDLGDLTDADPDTRFAVRGRERATARLAANRLLTHVGGA